MDIAALIVGTIAYYNIDPKSVFILFLTIAAYIGIGFWIVIENRIKEHRRRNSIVFLKKKNLVTAVEVNSSTFYLLEEDDDEGLFYLFQLENDKVFSFGGQDFYESDRFPNNKFEIVEGRGVKNEILILETFLYGDKIKPQKVISGKEKWNLLNSNYYPDPSKLTVTNGRIEDFIKE